MVRLFTIIAVLVLSVGSAHAQRSDYQITPQPGWKQVTAGQDVETYASPTDPDGVSVAIFPVVPLLAPVEQLFAMMNDSMNKNTMHGPAFSDKQAQPLQRSHSAGVEILVQTVSYAGEKGERAYGVTYARGEKDGFAVMIFLAENKAIFERNKPAVDAMFATLRLTDEMEKKMAEARKHDTQGKLPPPIR